MRRHLIVGAVGLPLALQGIVLGQVSVRLSGVPERLSFPLPDGANVMLTATIKGGEVQSVWLAPETPSSASARVVLTKVDDEQYQINLGGREVCDLLKAHAESREFRIFAEAADGTIVQSISVRYGMHAVPKRLDTPWDTAKMTVHQRSSKELPGSRGSLSLHIGDITAGQVLLTIYGPHAKPVIETTSVGEGDALPLLLEKEHYVLVVDKLVNVPIGEDYGIFSIWSWHAWERKRIEHFLRAMKTCGVTFTWNGLEVMTGSQFAALVYPCFDRSDATPVLLDEFVDRYAAFLEAYGDVYQVKLPDGQILNAAMWLREQAAKIKGKPEADDDSAEAKVPGSSEFERK